MQFPLSCLCRKGHTSQPRPLLLCIVQGSIDICIKHHKSQLLKAQRPAPSKNKESGTAGGGKVQRVAAWTTVCGVGVAQAPLPPTAGPTGGHHLLDFRSHSVPRASQQAGDLATPRQSDMVMMRTPS